MWEPFTERARRIIDRLQLKPDKQKTITKAEVTKAVVKMFQSLGYTVIE